LRNALMRFEKAARSLHVYMEIMWINKFAQPFLVSVFIAANKQLINYFRSIAANLHLLAQKKPARIIWLGNPTFVASNTQKKQCPLLIILFHRGCLIVSFGNKYIFHNIILFLKKMLKNISNIKQAISNWTINIFTHLIHKNYYKRQILIQC